MSPLEALAIILSVVSLIISIVAFFASLKFYRDGIQLQQSANDALTKISEKTDFIQTQVGGMFDKTLDAAIGKREMLSEQFEEINEQLEQTKAKLIEESVGQIGAAGEQERKRLARIVDDQIALLREKVETTRESAEEMVVARPENRSRESIRQQILSLLEHNPDGLTARQIQKSVHTPMSGFFPSQISRRLRELRDLNLVESDGDKYFYKNPIR